MQYTMVQHMAKSLRLRGIACIGFLELEYRLFHIRKYHKQKQRMLVCGDGDFSFAASIASQIAEKGMHLTATVLESESNHLETYASSEHNIQTIRKFGHEVLFNVDATRLYDHFPLSFDEIQFNFPHISGKNNTRYNRQLIKEFFASASPLLKKPTHESIGGRIHVALMSDQGGMHAERLEQWRQSWLPAVYAADANLLLVNMEPFEPQYNLSSYRFRDARFHLKDPFLYTFAPSSNSFISTRKKLRSNQLYSASSLNISLFCHFDIGLELQSNLCCEIENCLNNQLEDTGWLAKAYYRGKGEKENDRRAFYKIFIFGIHSPIRREAAELFWHTTCVPHFRQNFPIDERKHWSFSRLYPASFMPNYLTHLGIKDKELSTGCAKHAYTNKS